jgi:hypothetical protein
MMSNVANSNGNSGGRNLAPWFWIGAGVGFILSTAAVIVTAEVTRKRYRPSVEEQIEEEIDLVESLTYQLKESLGFLAEITEHSGHQHYRSASKERIRFGLNPGQSGSGSSGWYTGDDDADVH